MTSVTSSSVASFVVGGGIWAEAEGKHGIGVDFEGDQTQFGIQRMMPTDATMKRANTSTICNGRLSCSEERRGHFFPALMVSLAVSTVHSRVGA